MREQVGDVAGPLRRQPCQHTLDAFARFHMAGHRDADGRQMVEAIRRVTQRRTGRAPRVAAFPWWLLTLASPFVATFRELREMRYLWRTPVHLDNARLLALLGHEPHTPLDEAVEATLIGMGAIESAPQGESKGRKASMAEAIDQAAAMRPADQAGVDRQAAIAAGSSAMSVNIREAPTARIASAPLWPRPPGL
jgi:hypothetical protein